MKKNSPHDSLSKSIEQLEALRDQELYQIKNQLHEMHESLKPMNIIKDTIHTVTSSSSIKKKTGKTLVWFVSGLLVKNILFRGTLGPLKLASRFLFQTAAAGLIYKNSDKITSTGLKVIHALTPKSKH